MLCLALRGVLGLDIATYECSNLASYNENESKQSLVEMREKGQLVAFPISAIYSKAVYDKLQDFSVFS